ncbi:MAG: hypothetical protein E6J90_49520 [Deltaproteobacteria bacterium]|nr:MAG: hypothetical protein E6J90_49520 [Deltaproteobacteria bacterium]TMQ08321.1 MAG: hypothetical protein E6J91_33445 [Deltaproteobacteria bacterium]
MGERHRIAARSERFAAGASLTRTSSAVTSTRPEAANTFAIRNHLLGLTRLSQVRREHVREISFDVRAHDADHVDDHLQLAGVATIIRSQGSACATATSSANAAICSVIGSSQREYASNA